MGEMSTTLATKIVVKRTIYKEKERIDVRLWFKLKDKEEWIPTKKGVTVESSKLPELIGLLQNV